MKKVRSTAIPAVYLIFEREGKVLLARRANTGYQDGNWNLPSGHFEGDELPLQAGIRECLEEVGVELSPEDMRIAHVSYRPRHDKTDNRVDFFIEVTHWDTEPYNAEPEKCDALEWFPTRALPENMTSHVRRALYCIHEGIPFDELDEAFLRDHGEWELD